MKDLRFKMTKGVSHNSTYYINIIVDNAPIEQIESEYYKQAGGNYLKPIFDRNYTEFVSSGGKSFNLPCSCNNISIELL